MKAVILAAGKGERLRPLTLTKPKALAKVGDKTLLEHTIDALPEEVKEIILVVGYLGNQIRDFCGDNFAGRKIHYVKQKEQLGTGHALELCTPLLGEKKFFTLFADDLLDPKALKDCLKYDLAAIVQEHSDPSRFGVVALRADGSIASIVEKPANPPTNLVTVGPYLLDRRVLDYKVKPAANGEYYLPEMVGAMAKDHKVYPVRASFWIPIASIDDLKKAELKWRSSI